MVRMYVDGVEIASQELTGGLEGGGYSHASNSYIGTREKEGVNEPLQEFLHGFLKDVRVYGKALSPVEAVNLTETGQIEE